MATRFQQCCAVSRSLVPVCQHLSFKKSGAVCAKNVKLAQYLTDLGPDHGQMCEHFTVLEAPIEEPSKEEPKEEPKKAKRGRPKLTSKKEKEVSSDVSSSDEE